MEQFQEFVIYYGYYAVYFFLALGIFGLPIPDEIVVAFVGYLSSVGLLNFPISIFISILGVMTGTLFTFAIGRQIGKPLILKYGKWIRLTPERLTIIEGWFNRYGPWTITIGYFIPGMRHLVCYLSGVSGMHMRRYMVFASIGTLISSTLLITIGYILGFLHY